MNYSVLKDLLLHIKNTGQDEDIYIWGVGYYGNLLGQLFNRENVNWKGYYDNYDDACKRTLNGKDILSAKQIDKSVKAKYYISMKGDIAYIVKNQLMLEGVSEEKISVFEDITIYSELETLTIKMQPLNNNQIKTFHNVHKNKKCFVVGNGPSLLLEDLEKIQRAGYVTFASNYIFKCYENTSWRPNYYFVFDTNGIRRFLQDENIVNIISSNCDNIFSYNYMDENTKKIDNLITCNYICSNEVPMFSSDCERQVYSGKSVSYAMLQVAIYMGFSEIYLLGMDHSFSTEVKADATVIHNNVQDHAKELDCGSVSYFYVDEVTKAYLVAKKYADEHGVKIYNATRGGKLEVFERIDFEELINKEH